jgi:hypothetical protein
MPLPACWSTERVGLQAANVCWSLLLEKCFIGRQHGSRAQAGLHPQHTTVTQLA